MSNLIYLLFTVLFVAADQLSKAWMTAYLLPVRQMELIPPYLTLYYHRNYGAAFGILAEHQKLIIAVTALVMLGMTAAVLLKKVKGKMLTASFCLIVAGGLGNLIDRIRLGYVVDFVYLERWDWPIFNLADCFVVGGTALLLIYILFFDGKPAKNLEQPAGGDADAS